MDEKNDLATAAKLVQEARKSRMRTVQHYLCDSCDTEILSADNGFVIQGNVYTADPQSPGGLVGNNFPEPNKEGFVKLDAVRQTVLCKRCFMKAIGGDKKPGVGIRKQNIAAKRNPFDDLSLYPPSLSLQDQEIPF